MSLPTAAADVEWVVLLDPTGVPLGVADKAVVHHENTPLHLAFSCHLVDPAGRILLTRRALTKRTFPGVWTNSCCGHPGPGEPVEDAVRRRVRSELGLAVAELTVVLPEFRYRAAAVDGIVENEICPVYRGLVRDDPEPDPREVADWTWVAPGALVTAVTAVPAVFSPWLVAQLPDLVAHLPDLAG